MEKTIYAYLAQADLALEAFDAGLTVEQLMASKEGEAKAKAAPSQQVLKERRSKSAADVDAGTVAHTRKGAFKKRSVLPAKKLTSTDRKSTV